MPFSMSSDLRTRRIVWCMNDGSVEHPIGSPSFAIAGLFAELWKDEESAACPVSGWRSSR